MQTESCKPLRVRWNSANFFDLLSDPCTTYLRVLEQDAEAQSCALMQWWSALQVWCDCPNFIDINIYIYITALLKILPKIYFHQAKKVGWVGEEMGWRHQWKSQDGGVVADGAPSALLLSMFAQSNWSPAESSFLCRLCKAGTLFAASSGASRSTAAVPGSLCAGG